MGTRTPHAHTTIPCNLHTLERIHDEVEAARKELDRGWPVELAGVSETLRSALSRLNSLTHP